MTMTPPRAITTANFLSHLADQEAMDPETPIYLEVGGVEFPLTSVRIHFANDRVCQVTLVGRMDSTLNLLDGID